MRPRVLFVDHVGVLGGGEWSLLDIAGHFKETSSVILFEDGPFKSALADASVDVEILTAPGSVQEVSRGGGLRQDLAAIPGVWKLAGLLARKARAYDVIYANSQKSMIVAALASLRARRPLIWHLRDLMTTEHFSRFHCRVTTGVANLFVNRVIANSHATRTAFIERGGLSRRVVTVHNGINDEPFTRVVQDEVEALRMSLGLNGAPLIGVFSRLAEWKGQHVLLQALGEVRDTHGVFVGDALFGEDKIYAEELRTRADQLGIADRVHFLGFRKDIPQLVSMVDVVVHTSIAAEPFGRVIVEGMLAEKPVVATQAGGAIEIIDDGSTGFLIPPNDPTTLASVLKRVLANKDATKKVASAGKAKALSHFSVETMLSGVEQHVLQVCKRSN